MSEKQFYLLALDRVWEDLAWWRPNRCGYTSNLDDAGIYSEEEARALSSGVDDPLPVAVDEAKQLATTRTYIAYDDDAIERFKRSWGSRR